MDWLDALPDTRVLREPAQTLDHTHDESHVRGPPPRAVVKPRSAEALRELVRRAGEEEFTLVPRGAGSGKAGGCVPSAGSVVVDLSDWPGAIAVNRANLTLSAPASAGLAAVKAQAEAAAAMLSALANPHRLMILCLLLEAELPVGVLTERVGLSQSAMSQHLARMRHQGIVSARRDGQSIHYSVADPAVREVIATLYESLRVCDLIPENWTV